MNPERQSGAPSLRSRSGVGFQIFRSLKYRDFRLLWFGVLGGSSGQWLEQIAVGWLVLNLTDSALWVGVAAACRGMPSLLFSPVGGVLADRIDRRKLVAFTQGWVAMIAAIMAFLNFTGEIQLWQVLVLTAAFGSIWAMNAPARLSMIPGLVPREDLLNAVALNFIALNVSRSLGPFIAGVVLATLGFGELFAMAASFYALIVVITLMMRTPTRPEVAAGQSFIENIVEGVRYLRGNRALFTVLACALFVILIGMPFVALIPVFAPRRPRRRRARAGADGRRRGHRVAHRVARHGDGAGLPAAGALSGGLRPRVWPVADRLRPLRSLRAVAGHPAGRGRGKQHVHHDEPDNQLLVSDAMRGRVTSILLMEFGLVPLGAIAAGAAAEVFSPGAAVAAMGVILSTAAVAAYFGLSELRRIDISGGARPAQ